MIKEIVIGKRYKAKDYDHFRTPLMVYDDCVFYKYEGAGSGCYYDSIESFKKMVEEIPEAPEEWFEVFYRLKNGKLHTNPTLARHLYRSKEEFLSCCKKEEDSFDLIKLRKVEL